jgi:hypothetical protein
MATMASFTPEYEDQTSRPRVSRTLTSSSAIAASGSSEESALGLQPLASR